jgi:hypothetical protein
VKKSKEYRPETETPTLGSGVAIDVYGSFEETPVWRSRSKEVQPRSRLEVDRIEGMTLLHSRLSFESEAVVECAANHASFKPDGGPHVEKIFVIRLWSTDLGNPVSAGDCGRIAVPSPGTRYADR